MTVAVQSIKELIHARKSVRKYDANAKISNEEITSILQQATTAPSSSNLQPWRFVVIQDAEVKKELRAIAFNQEQVETASAVIAVFGDTKMYEKAEPIYKSAMARGYIPEDVAEKMITSTYKTYAGLTEEERKNIVSFDAGLISMQILLLAKNAGYDTVVMGGFNKKQLKDRLQLPEHIVPIVLIAIGKAADEARNTSRLAIDEITSFI